MILTRKYREVVLVQAVGMSSVRNEDVRFIARREEYEQTSYWYDHEADQFREKEKNHIAHS